MKSVDGIGDFFVILQPRICLMCSDIITINIVAAQSNLLDDFTASMLTYLDFGSDGYKIFQSRLPRAVDGCSVFAVISLGTEGEVVGWGKMPLP